MPRLNLRHASHTQAEQFPDGTTTIKRQLIMGKVSVEPQPEVLRRQAMLASGKRMEKKTSAKLALLRALRAGSLMASSAESVGRFWLRKFSELMKQSDLNVFKRLKAIGFSHGQFGFVVEALHNT